jgi:short-subunit dehydrogenase
VKNLYFGASSDLAKKFAKSMKNVDAVSSKKINKYYSKVFKINNYNHKNIFSLKKIITEQYDNVLIFNGSFSSSFLSIFSRKKFLDDFNINYLIPLEISSFVIQKNLLKKNGAIYFISSIAASEDKIGNANYSISKNALNFSSQILSNEQKKRNVRVNCISFGLIKNQMGIKVKKITNSNKKFISLNNSIKKIKVILNNKKINKKIIKFY